MGLKCPEWVCKRVRGDKNVVMDKRIFILLADVKVCVIEATGGWFIRCMCHVLCSCVSWMKWIARLIQFTLMSRLWLMLQSVFLLLAFSCFWFYAVLKATWLYCFSLVSCDLKCTTKVIKIVSPSYHCIPFTKIHWPVAIIRLFLKPKYCWCWKLPNLITKSTSWGNKYAWFLILTAYKATSYGSLFLPEASKM